MPVHGLLERVVLPPEDVVGVVREARGVPARPHEGLFAVGEVRRVDRVEAARVPDRLEEDLGQAHGMRRRAGTARLEGPALWVRDVVLVVRRVQVHAVPARGEPMVRHDTVRTGLRGEVDRLGRPRAGVFHAGVS